MKKFFKWFGVSLLATVLLAGSFVAHEWYAEKPFVFRAYLDRTLIKFALQSPETLTSLGFLEAIGIKGHNAELDDDSPERADALYEQLVGIKATLQSYDDDELSESEQLSKRIALYLLNQAEEAKPFRYHNYPLNQMFGVQNQFPSFMDAQHQVTSVEDAEHYIARLEKLETKFAQNLEGLKRREHQGILPPEFVMQRVLDEMHGFVNQPVEENILYTSLDKKLTNAEQISEQEKIELLARTARVIEEQVHPAYQLFINYFESRSDNAPTDDGFWRLPDGDKAYEMALRRYTTTDYSADTIHKIGLEEVDRIQSEILTILEAQGYDISQGFTYAIERLAADPKFYYQDSDEGREEILADYQKILDEIDTGISEVFNNRPETGMKVKRIPLFKEKTAPGAYYQRPTVDGSRPGVFYANLYDIKATPKYGMRTLAYHEGIPGHHFQVALSMELEGLPFIRKISPFTAYVEGWALYAERLAWEMGFQDDPFDNIGRLQAELFRAVRLVVDTGIHYGRWTRERAIEYMKTNTGMAETDVVSEIERYIVLPGQATAYKIGMMKILELRSKAKQALGAQFDLAKFHDVVLMNGAVPLDVLEALVDDYIAATLSGTPKAS